MTIEVWQTTTCRIKLAFLARVLIFLFGVEYTWIYIANNYKPDLDTLLVLYRALPPQAKACITRVIHEMAGDDEQMEDLLMEI
jgi:hypothetical protein